MCVDVPSTTCESKPVDACTSIELELCKDVSTLFMKIMLVEAEEENDEFNVCLYEFELDKYQWETYNLRFLKNSVAWRKRRFVFIHFIHMIISVIKVATKIHFLTTSPTTHRFASPPTSPPPPPRRCTTPPTRSQPRPKVPKLRCNMKLLSKLRENLVRSGANTGNIQVLSSWKEKYFRNEAKSTCS